MSAITPDPDPENFYPTLTGTVPYAPSEPIDLRTIPLERWADYESFPVLVPPDVAHYLTGATQKLTVLEIDHLEARIEAFHGMQTPWGVSLSGGIPTLIHCGE